MDYVLILLGIAVAVVGWLYSLKVDRETGLLGALPIAVIRFGSAAGAAGLILAGVLVALV